MSDAPQPSTAHGDALGAEGAGVRAIVAAHGDLAMGLVSAVRQITGRDDLFLPLSNRDLARDEIEQAMRDALAATGARTVFTDLPGGSWTIAARRLLRAAPSVVLVTGVSLPVLLDWLFHDGETTGEAAQAAAEKGRQAMLVVGGGDAH